MDTPSAGCASPVVLCCKVRDRLLGHEERRAWLTAPWKLQTLAQMFQLPSGRQPYDWKWAPFKPPLTHSRLVDSIRYGCSIQVISQPTCGVSIGRRFAGRCIEMMSFSNVSVLSLYLVSIICAFVMSRRSSNSQIRVLALTVWL